MTHRRFWVLVHRVNGLALAAFLTVVGSTGAVLAWRVPLERIFAPQLFAIRSAGTSGSVDPIEARLQVARAFPWARVDMLDLSAPADAPLEFTISPKPGESFRHVDDSVFLDPFTGRVLGSRRDGDIRQGSKNLIPFVYRLHEELALGSFGTICLGVVALLWVLDCFVGMYLSFPPGFARLGQAPGLGFVARFARWVGRFAPSLRVRWRRKSFVVTYDLHRASGVWLWVMLLIFAWTGVAFNLPVLYQRVMHLAGGTVDSSTGVPQACAALLDSDTIDWPGTLATARHLMAIESRQRQFHTLKERFLSYDRETCIWTYRVRSTLDIDRIGNTQMQWLRNDPARALFRSPLGKGRADALTTWLEAIHEAQVGGMTIRVLVFLTGLITVLLSITGVLIFLAKIRKRKTNHRVGQARWWPVPMWVKKPRWPAPSLPSARSG